MGIIGDTNRFMYSATDERTFEAAMYLYNYDFDMQALLWKNVYETCERFKKWMLLS